MKLCADSSLVSDVHPSPNIEPRRGGAQPNILVMHYTGLPTVEKSIEILSRPDCKVSCHYVVDLDGRVTQMVAESMRAWHAGVSSWHGETDINSYSIGIEIQNVGHNRDYPDFPAPQMEMVRDLARDIISRHSIPPQNVVAHSDIAPGRKTDPGEKFNWAWLHRHGVGHWVTGADVATNESSIQPGDCGERIKNFQSRLKQYGYGIEVTGCHDACSVIVTTAFQRHFRPECFDGCVDAETDARIAALLASRPSDAIA